MGVVWYENDGAQTFASRPIPSSVQSGTAVFVGDVDGNGWVDIVAASSVSNTIVCLLNQGDGSFIEQTVASSTGSVTDLHATDLDGDGDLDLLAARSSNQRVTWYEPVYNASLTSIPGDWTEGPSPWAVEFRIPEAIDRPTTLAFTVSGEPAYGIDYTLAGAASFDGARGFVEIPAGETVATIYLSALDDGLYELDEAVTVTLLRGPGENARPLSAHTKSIRSTLAGGSFGDAPQPYPTRLAEGGAAHTHVGDGSLRLGALVDGRADGAPSAGADANVSDDGVVFGPMRVGQLGAEVTVTVSNAPEGARVDAWIDFNGDGSWGGADEQILASVHVVNGVNVLTFDVPTVIASGEVTYARFRLSSEGGLGPEGVAVDGEVEDYAVTVLAPVATDGVFGAPTQILPASAIAYSDTIVLPFDVDEDGDLDLLFSSPGSSSGLVWHENVGGLFLTARTIGVGAYAIRLADLDRDGDVDLLAAEFNLLVWHENLGSGGFVRHAIASGFPYPYTPLGLGDFDGDGWLDVVSVASNGNIQLWSRMTSSATYTPRDIGGSGWIGPFGLEAADLDGDGRLDLVVAGNDFPFGDIVGLFQAADGQFSGRTLDGTQSPKSIPADLDHDGDIDLVVQSDSGVIWLENDGTGVFEYQNVGAASGNPNSIAVADFDGDGDLDVIDASRSASFQPSSFTLFTNDGSQRFLGTPIESGSPPVYDLVVPADMNGDGAIDLVAVSRQHGVRLYTQTLRAIPSSTSPNLLHEGGGPITVRLDLQAETNADLVVPFTISGEAVYGVDYVIDGADSISGNAGVATIPAGARWVDLTLTVIADGAPELYEWLAISVGDRPGDKLVRWIAADEGAGDYGDAPERFPVGIEQSGAGHLAVGPRLGDSRTTEPHGTATSDASGDSGDDGVTFGPVVVGSSLSSMTVDVQNAPAGGFVDVWIDFNGDGDWSGELEQVFARRPVVEGANVLQFEVPSWATAAATYARVRLSSTGGLGVRGNAADGEVEDHQLTIASPLGGWVDYELTSGGGASTPYAVVKPVDLDRDGRTDLVVAGSGSDQSVYWLKNEGDYAFSTHQLAIVDRMIRDLAIDDIDGDGDWDIVVASQPTTSGSRLVLLRNDGANTFVLSVIAANVEGSRSVTLVDLNGDGSKDLVAGGFRGNQSTASNVAGEVAWYANDGLGNFTRRLLDSQFGPVVNVGAADLDGDGDLDLYASAMNSGSLLLYRNKGDAAFTKEVIVATTGLGTQMYVGGRVRAADLDGDGDLDLIAPSANFGPRNVAWYENDGSGVFVQRIVYAGVVYTNDILPADLDGDGDLDLAIAYLAGAPGARPAWIETRLAGDANNDGVVDLADLDFWRANYGATTGAGLVADLTGDGAVNAADYTAWRDAYESGVASIVYLPRSTTWTFDATSLAAADLDGDLDLDLIAATSTGIALAVNASLQPAEEAVAAIVSEADPARGVALTNWPAFALSPTPDAILPRQRFAAPLRETTVDRSLVLLGELSAKRQRAEPLSVIDEAFADAAGEATDRNAMLTLSDLEEALLDGGHDPDDWN